MESAFNTFFELVKGCAPYSILWGLGILAYRSVVNAITGKDVTLR